MGLRFLLDANACIRLINGTSQALIERLALRVPTELGVPAIVEGELAYGAYNSAHAAENLRLVLRFLEPFAIVPFDSACAYHYGRIRAELKRQGVPIGANDLLIAATAVANDLVLVTNNTREFARVVGLVTQDWEA